MNPIHPLQVGSSGPAVANLQDALLALLKNNIFQARIAPNSPTQEELDRLRALLLAERAQSFFGEATLGLVFHFQLQQGLGDNLRGMVEDKTAAKLNEWLKKLGLLDIPIKESFMVSGHVRRVDGTPLVGVLVSAFDIDMRSEEFVGKTFTDGAGYYEITYSAEPFSSADARPTRVDLIVRVSADDGTPTLAASPILFNAEPVAVVDITVGGEYRGLSEYNVLMTELVPLLQGVPLHELTTEDIDFLAGDTGLDPQRITWLAESARRVLEVDSILAQVFYGLFRQNLPTDLPALLNQDIDVLRRALETSIRDNIIPLIPADMLDEIMVRFLTLKASLVLKPAGENERASFGDLVRTVMADSVQLPLLADLFVRHHGTTEEFWLAVGARPEFGVEEETHVRKLVRTTLELGAFTGNHLPLVLELQRMGQDDPTFTELRGLAALTEADWREVIQRKQQNGLPIGFPADTPGANDQEKVANYANTLNQLVENTFPTTVIAQRVVRDDDNNSPFKPVKADLTIFFTNNPKFEFRADPVDLYLSDARDHKLRDVADPGTLTIELKSMQRVFNITPRFEQMRALLADDLHSSQTVVAMGQRAFVEKHSATFGGEETALTAYKQAEHIHMTALTLYARHSAAYNAPTPYVIAGEPSGAVAQAKLRGPTPTNTANDAAWRTLFGSIDLCDCEHCKSVYSPAAYLVDILKFLKDGPTKHGVTPLQVLLDRRPDLEHIELTCENTDTPLPYVDLVQEVLENAIAPFKAFVILPSLVTFPAWMPQVDLNQKNLSPQLRGAFATQNITLAQSAIIKVVEQGKHWLIADPSRFFTLIREPSQANAVRVISQNLQTGGTAEALGANPEHVNPTAYNTLASAVYPWTLPLNLWVEEARVYLEHLGVQRHEVIETVFTGTPSATATAKDLEHLGLSTEEAKIIDGTTIGGPSATASNSGAWNFWGLSPSNNDIIDPMDGAAPHATGHWDVVLQRVSVFLQRSGLSYKELLELLGTYFINPPASAGTPGGRLLGIVSNDANDAATCNLSKLEIQIVDNAIAINGYISEGIACYVFDAQTLGTTPLYRVWNPNNGDHFYTTILAHRDNAIVNGGYQDEGIACYVFDTQTLGTTPLYRVWNPNTGDHFYTTILADQKNAIVNGGYQDEGIACYVFDTQTLGTMPLYRLFNPKNGDHFYTTSLKRENLKAAWNKIHRFVRLWRKLGWTMRDLDKAITALKPTDLDDYFLLQLSDIQRLRADLHVPLVTMLSWWAAIDTASYRDQLTEGQPEVASLYQQLFRNKAVITPLDQAFTAEASALVGKISEHLPTIYAALGIRAADLSALSTAAAVANDKLNLVNLSCLYRVASLAKALKLSIAEYLSIQQLTSIDPFAVIPATTTAPSLPATSATLRFVDKVNVIRTSGFSIDDLNYLLRHEYGATSGIVPSEQSIALILAEIRDGLQKIAAEYAFVPDPTGELTRKTLVMTKTALRWEDADIEQAIALLDGTAIYAEPLAETESLTLIATGKFAYDAIGKKLRWVGSMSGGEKALLLSFATDAKYREAVNTLFKRASAGQANIVSLDSLPPLSIAKAGQGKIGYDKQTQTLRFTGPMTLAEKALLLALGADEKMINALFLQPRSFIADKLQSFLDPAAGKIITLLDQESSSEEKFAYVLVQLLAYARIFLGKSLVKQKLGEALQLEATLIELLLEKLLKSPTDANQPAMSDFLALLDGGLTATYFATNDLTGASEKRTDPTINFKRNFASATPFSARWLGKVQPKYSESYTFLTYANGGVRLWVDNQLIIDQAQDQLATEYSATIALKANQLYDIKMEYSQNDSQAVAELHWSSPSTPKAIISANHLFPDAPVLTYQSLHKIARLVSTLRISDVELAYLSAQSSDRKWLDVTALPLVETQSSASRFAAWERLVNLFRFRDSLPAAKLPLFTVFKQATKPTTTKAELLKTLSECTGWNLIDLEFLDSAQGLALPFPNAYQNEQALVRLQACFKLMKRLGASAKQLSEWGKTNQTATEALDNARAIKNAVKAKYDDKQWLAVAKPLKDQLREKQRAALVAYLVAERGVRDGNELYDDFLIDVEMSPCMITTRIKQAISSVQLFIQRCLMNLEPAVSLSSEDAKEWGQWRKQYRIWEANRKVFLYPENWIEPELRDDKSPFFKDLENELLQNDVTMDTAETAFLHYLEKLDEVARLEICGMYQQDEKAANKTEKDINVLHVFGRTFAIPHIYYYRKLEDSVWSAWEKVDLDIEGDHLIPVVWNRRLQLFWPIFMEKAEEPTSLPAQGTKPQKYWEIQIAWSEYQNGRWSAKQTSPTGQKISPYSAKDRFVFKGFALDDNLIIRIYTTTSPVTKFENLSFAPRFEFRFVGCKGMIIPSDAPAGGFPMFLPTGTNSYYMRFVEVAQRNEFYLSKRTYPLLPLKTIIELKDFSSTTYYASGAWKVSEQIAVLKSKPSPVSLVTPQQDYSFFLESPFFYQDSTRTFFVMPLADARNYADLEEIAFATNFAGALINLPAIYKKRFRFDCFYHPFVCDFIKQLRRHGIDGLLNPDEKSPFRRQLHYYNFFNKQNYDPFVGVRPPHPRDEVDFEYSGAYALYNWELFFHTPFLIATRLSKNQRFEEARKWFHYIFDPTATDSPGRPNNPGPERFWKVKPFYTIAMSPPQTLSDLLKDAADLQEQVEAWRKNPFKPHVVARLRLVAYMKAVVMKYIDNLIAWGDQLFRRDTIESINEATQLYILAAQILGRRPEEIPPRAVPEVQTFNAIKTQLTDVFGPIVNIENYISPSGPPNSSLTGGTSSLGTMPLFCIPKNDKLLGYWSTVADRLFKIRHCMNIEGVVRQLPIFEPPIDPALLVRAAAAGVDISSALSDSNAALPHYRFNVMLQKATELCNDVKALGGALLSVLEKRDAEALGLLRSSHELILLNAVREIKQKQIDEATNTWQGLQKSKDVVTTRRDYYTNIEFMTEWEKVSLMLTGASLISQTVATILDLIAGGAHVTPSFTVGVSGAMGSPVMTVKYGGENIARGAESWAMFAKDISGILSTGANMSSTYGSYWRRWDDWKLQEKLANKELDQIDKQIAAAQIRVAICEHELKNHDLQVENAKEVEAFMRDKYTNQQLYDWMVGQISSLYFQSYQMAYDIAKRAERAFRHELCLADSNFIQFGYWDSLKKGLLAGERLHYDLKRMDMAYLDQNKREYELTKHVSLQQLNPLALLALKATGACEVTLPEWLFDLDGPGHYMRRLKNVSLSIPSVTGPYTSVSCTLTLLKSSLRKSPLLTDGYKRQDSEDGRFVDYLGTIQSIVTSSGNNDSGLFETNLRDERFLPFEGAGAQSTWKLELPAAFRQFDYNTISDAILHVRYTARQGGTQLRDKAVEYLESLVHEANTAGLALLLSLPHDFPSEWHRFVTGNAHFTAKVKRDSFPYFTQGKKITITAIELYAIQDNEMRPPTTPQNVGIVELTTALNGNGEFALSLAPDSALVREQQAHVFVLIKYRVGSA